MRLLDLYCGEGGASMGYYRAGFTEIVGVDIRPQPRYPFTFVQADVLALPLNLRDFDAVHASPPCQKYSWAAQKSNNLGAKRADLVDPTREILKAAGVPYVMENVIGAPLRSCFTLCGEMFGLGVIRHRLFESNIWMLVPPHKPHLGLVTDGTYVTVAGHGGDNIRGRGGRAAKQKAMGIDWMSDEGLNEAIPPAYTEWIGERIIEAAAGNLKTA